MAIKITTENGVKLTASKDFFATDKTDPASVPSAGQALTDKR